MKLVHLIALVVFVAIKADAQTELWTFPTPQSPFGSHDYVNISGPSLDGRGGSAWIFDYIKEGTGSVGSRLVWLSRKGRSIYSLDFPATQTLYATPWIFRMTSASVFVVVTEQTSPTGPQSKFLRRLHRTMRGVQSTDTPIEASDALLGVTTAEDPFGFFIVKHDSGGNVLSIKRLSN